jgi:hypothetical protein
MRRVDWIIQEASAIVGEGKESQHVHAYGRAEGNFEG